MKENEKFFKVLIASAALIGSMALPSGVEAATILSRTDSGTLITSDTYGAGNNLTIDLGTGLSGAPSSALFYLYRQASASSNAFLLSLNCYTDSGYSSACSGTNQWNYTLATISTVTKTLVSANLLTPNVGPAPAFDHTRYYRLTMSQGGGGSFPNAGSPFDGFRTLSYGSANSSPSANAYVVVEGTQDSGDTRIVSEDTPPNGSITGSTSVGFTFQYYFNDVADFGRYDLAGVELQDLTNFSIGIGPPESAITASGYSTYSQTKTLTTGHEYMWRAYLRSASTTEKIFGGLTTFFVVSNPYPIDLNSQTTSTGSTTEQFSSGLTGLFNGITTGPPFGFIFSVISAVRTLNASSTPSVYLRVSDQIRSLIISPFDISFSALFGFFFVMWAWHRFTAIQL